MGKRSNFERKERDYYKTPLEAVIPLLPFISGTFIEPCAGNGLLIDHLVTNGLICAEASDIQPEREDIIQMDVLSIKKADHQFITNPPWERKLLHRIISKLRVIQDTWLLFDADWMHTTQATPYIKYCWKIISVGRISWEQNGIDGKDNCCWYLFKKEKNPTFPHMIMLRERGNKKRCKITKDLFE